MCYHRPEAAAGLEGHLPLSPRVLGLWFQDLPLPPQLWNQIHGSSHPSHEMMLDTRPSASTAGLEARLYSPGWLPPLLPACLPHQLTQISFLFLLFKLFSGNKAIFLLPSRQKQRSLNLRKIHVYILWHEGALPPPCIVRKDPRGPSFPIWNQSVPCPVLTVASSPAYRFLKRQVK